MFLFQSICHALLHHLPFYTNDCWSYHSRKMISFFIDPTPPIVTITSSVNEVPAVGLSYNLSCSVSIIHLVVEPMLQWMNQDGGILIYSTSGTSLQLHFDSLHISDSSLYTCKATINITSLDLALSAEASYEILLDCKLSIQHLHLIT